MENAKHSEAGGRDTLLPTFLELSEYLRKAYSLWVNTELPPQMEHLRKYLRESLAGAFGSVLGVSYQLLSEKDYTKVHRKVTRDLRDCWKGSTPS